MLLRNQLQKLGFSAREAEVYLALLELGTASGSEIARKSSLVISTVYFILEELRKKGLVTKAIGRTKKFTAKDPTELLSEKKRDVTDFESLLPQLLAKTHRNNKPNILYFEGLDGMGEAYTYLANHAPGEELCAFFTYTPETTDQTQRFKMLQPVFTHMGKQNIHIRGISPNHSTINFMDPFTEEFAWEYRMLPIEVYSPMIATFIIKQYTLITSRNKGQSLFIENEDIAHAQKQIFEILWGLATPFPHK